MSPTIEQYLALNWGLMSPSIHKEANVLMVGTMNGTEILPCDMLGLPDPPDKDEEEAVHTFAEIVAQYLTGGITDLDSLCNPVSGYVCRLSASGYMDCTGLEYCETESDVLLWLKNEAELAGLSVGPDKKIRVLECTSNMGEICYYSRYDGSSVDGLSTVSYGDMQHASKSDIAGRKLDQLWLSVSLATGSDYSGGSVTLANYRELEKLQKDNEEHMLTGFGGYGAYSVYVRLDAPDELWEVVTSLADYPSLDDEAVSEVEDEWRQDAMAEAAQDTANHIARSVCPHIDDMPAGQFDLIIGKLRTICETCAQAFEGWEYEHASAYASPEKIAEDVMEREEWKALHADIFASILGDRGTSDTLVRVTSEGGRCVEEYSPYDVDTPHDDLIALCQREYGSADITIEIFDNPTHPLDLKA